jgi:hypothetical protein
MPRRLHFFHRLCLWLLLLSLVLAQTISVAHRAVHWDLRLIGYAHEEQKYEAQHHDAQHQESHAHDPAHVHSPECLHTGWIAKLFQHHEEGDEQCRLIDGASSFETLKSLPVGIDIAQPASLLIAFTLAELAAKFAALFDARGPPSVL